jgi:hypothetical protein
MPCAAAHCASLLQVTEESLATFFADCGTVMDCRICGDPNSAVRFAFIEFLEEAGAQEVRLRTLPLLLLSTPLRVLLCCVEIRIILSGQQVLQCSAWYGCLQGSIVCSGWRCACRTVLGLQTQR